MVSLGKDISCTKTLRTGRYAKGPRIVAEALYRRFTTRRGLLRGGEAEQNYGLDLTELVGSSTSTKDAASLEGKVRGEASKDERIQTLDVSVLPTKVGPAVSFAIRIDGTTGEGPFTLELGVSAVSVELVGITTGDA